MFEKKISIYLHVLRYSESENDIFNGSAACVHARVHPVFFFFFCLIFENFAYNSFGKKNFREKVFYIL